MMLMGNHPDAMCVFTYVQSLCHHLSKIEKKRKEEEEEEKKQKEGAEEKSCDVKNEGEAEEKREEGAEEEKEVVQENVDGLNNNHGNVEIENKA